MILEVLDPLLGGHIAVVALDSGLAIRTAEIRSSHYHRSSRPISLADAVLLASCGAADRIATSDPDVLAVADVEGLATVPLTGQG